MISCTINILNITSCKNEKGDLIEVDLMKIYKSKIKVYDTNMMYFIKWGSVNIKKESDLNETLIKDIKVYKDYLYILTISNVIKCYSSETGVLMNEYILDDSIIDFDLDTLNMNLLVLNSTSLSLYNDKAELIRLVDIEKFNSYSRCAFVENKILLISSLLPQCDYLLLDTIGDNNIIISASYKSNSISQLIKPLFFIGNDHNSILYKNILNDTIYRFENNKFIPHIKSSIGKYGIIPKRNGIYKDNERFRVLNMWHINNYWFLQYTYRLTYNKKKIDWTGLAVMDNNFNLLKADYDSYVIGHSIYFDGKLALFTNKENDTFYQVYEKSKSKMYINDSDSSLSDSISINYFKVR